jgi:hypothetical protein
MSQPPKFDYATPVKRQNSAGKTILTVLLGVAIILLALFLIAVGLLAYYHPFSWPKG